MIETLPDIFCAAAGLILLIPFLLPLAILLGTGEGKVFTARKGWALV